MILPREQHHQVGHFILIMIILEFLLVSCLLFTPLPAPLRFLLVAMPQEPWWILPFSHICWLISPHNNWDGEADPTSQMTKLRTGGVVRLAQHLKAGVGHPSLILSLSNFLFHRPAHLSTGMLWKQELAVASLVDSWITPHTAIPWRFPSTVTSLGVLQPLCPTLKKPVSLSCLCYL